MHVHLLSTYEEFIPDTHKDTTIIVLDVLRATTTMITALANGAKKIIPVEHIEEAQAVFHRYNKGEALLCGERYGLPIEGFHLGNSPELYQRSVVEGKTIILTTMNGTRALKACDSGTDVSVASFVNVTATVEKILTQKRDCTLVCAGMDLKFTLDDAICAGMIIHELEKQTTLTCSDLGWSMKTMFENYKNRIHPLLENNCYGYRYLKNKGFEKDLEFCLTIDLFHRIPVYVDSTVKNGR